MLALTDAVIRRWAEVKAEFESSCRSGSQPDAKTTIAGILDEITALVRSVGLQELDAIRRQSGATPPPAPGPMPAARPDVTTDLGEPGAGPAMTTELGARVVVVGAAPNTVPPSGTGASDLGFEFDAPRAPAPNQTPTVDQTGAYTPADSQLEPTKTFHPQQTERSQRKVPVVPGYQLTGVLGRGGMGVVYKATQLGLNRIVALKMILAGEHASPSQLARFASEARAVAAIRHPNIVQVYEIGEHEGLPYFSLEFCSGGSLDRKLKHEPQPPKAAAELLEQLARAVAAAHAAGVIHRDLKPANVLLDADGTPKVTDFGLARATDGAEANTRTGAVLGTPNYMSPEQAFGNSRDVGPAADQYSLGATLYEFITGRPPFQGANVMETLEQVRKKEPVPPTQLQPACPRDLETICLKALAKEPEKRYPNCTALADDLRAFLEGRPIAARPVGSIEKAWRWAKRNPRVAGLSSLVAMLLLVLGAGGIIAAAIFDEKKQAAEKARDEKDAALQAETKALGEKDAALQAQIKALAGERQARQAEEAALNKEKIAHAEAESRFDFARNSLVEIVDDVPIALRQAIFSRGAEQQVLLILRNMLERHIKDAAVRGLPDRGLHGYHIRMGELFSRQGRFPEAEKEYLEARGIAERMVQTDDREKDKAKANLALAQRLLGTTVLQIRRNADESLKLYAAAEKLQREVVTNPLTGEIPPAEAKQALAATLMDEADVYRRIMQFDKAFAACDESLKLWNEVVKLPATPYTANAPQYRAEALLLLGRIQARRGEDLAAENALTEATGIYRKLLEKEPTNLTVQVAAARAYRELGDFLLMRNRLKEAEPYHVWDLELTSGLLRTPEILSAQSDLSDAYYRSATLALKNGNRTAAEKLYRKCLDLRMVVAEARTDDLSLIRVANAQSRCGLHLEATRTMDQMLSKFAGKPNAHLLAAFVYSICSDTVTGGQPDDKLTSDEKALRQMYADRALALLDELVTKFKYSDVIKLKTDPDFDAIRRDPRFQAIIQKLEKAQPGK